MTAALRRLAPLLFALVIATGLLGAPATAAPVRAAAPDLTIVSDARYDVQPAQKRVRVTVTLRLTNHLKDTATKRFYFDQAFLAVLPGSTGFALSGGAGTSQATVSKRSSNATILKLGLGTRLFSGKSATYTLRFDLVDTGGASTRDLRIGDSLASFPVWAYASDSTPGSSVTVVFPPGYQTSVEAGSIPTPTTDPAGRTIYSTGALSTPLTFFAYLVGDRPGAYAERSLTASVGGVQVPVTIRSWSDDGPWGKRVGDLVKRALPTLGEAIGLHWPRTDTLVIQEAVSRSTGGYAGLFDPTKGLVEVAYYADDFVVLHETAHSWFNGALLADRWANEAFASYYGLQAATALRIPVTANDVTKALRKSAIPLNAWGPVGKETTAVEDYAYAATLALAKAIAERAGPDGLRAVWADAAGHVGAYQPPLASTGGATAPPPEPGKAAGPPDWRNLLDLLEAETPATYGDLWKTWVARPEDLPLLAARSAARTRYDAVVAQAGDWQLPTPVRDAMRAWRFDEATALLDDAGSVLAHRATIQAAAANAGLMPPTTLRDAFQGTDGFADALAEASAEEAAITRYQAALDAAPVAPDLVVQVGLWGAAPDLDLAKAKTSFAAGDLVATVASADAARSVWASAADVGQGRMLSVAALGLALAVALVLLGLAFYGRRTRRRREASFAASMSRPVSRMMARPMNASDRPRTAVPGVDGARPYATLAATPEERPTEATPHESDTGAGSG
jgi:hypothetical protein